jgi:hypothetical protein
VNAQQGGDPSFQAAKSVQRTFQIRHDTDNDQVPDDRDDCPDSGVALSVTERGCPSRLQLFIADDPLRKSNVRLLSSEVVWSTSPLFAFAVRTAGSPQLSSVTFLLDGKKFSVDRKSPYDLAGTNDGRKSRPAVALDPGVLRAGTHELTAVARFADKSTERITSTFTVEEGLGSGLFYSSFSSRRYPYPLGDAQVTGKIAVFVGPSTRRLQGVRSIKFQLDGRTVRVDTSAPFDLKGNRRSRAQLLNTSGLKEGEHTVKATVTLLSGRTVVWTASFTVVR